ncbi:hypothetical protein BDV23DRAFT_154383 [Aspergillus alliaceus]|uniref:Uncharacterized protein n=1 Tax=Petromyces alliaceus TaxID=209559 RepID=A0A5N7CAE1_PETAA|nr:hypothetical protein BDV23DRAFT_154383 [Aspergillus alliaceus]
MSRSMLSSAARQLWRQQFPRRGVPVLPSSKTRLSISPSLGDSTPRRQLSYASCESKTIRLNTPRRTISPFMRVQQHCAFSSSSIRTATKVLQNPRTGEDGNPLMIDISPRAAEVCLHLRSSVASSCSTSVWFDSVYAVCVGREVSSSGCGG